MACDYLHKFETFISVLHHLGEYHRVIYDVSGRYQSPQPTQQRFGFNITTSALNTTQITNLKLIVYDFVWTVLNRRVIVSFSSGCHRLHRHHGRFTRKRQLKGAYRPGLLSLCPSILANFPVRLLFSRLFQWSRSVGEKTLSSASSIQFDGKKKSRLKC